MQVDDPVSIVKQRLIRMLEKASNLTTDSSSNQVNQLAPENNSASSLNLEPSHPTSDQYQVLPDNLAKKNMQIEDLRSDNLKMEAFYQRRLDQSLEALMEKNMELKSTVRKRELEFQGVNLRLVETLIEKESVINTNKQLLAEKEEMAKTTRDLEHAISRLQSEKLENRKLFTNEVAKFKATFGVWMELGRETEILLKEKCDDFVKIRAKYDELEASKLKQDGAIWSRNQEFGEKSKFLTLEKTKLESKLESLGFRCSGLEFKTRCMESTLQEKQATIDTLQMKCTGLENLYMEQTSLYEKESNEFKAEMEMLVSNNKKLEDEIDEVKKANKNLEEEQILLKKGKEELEVKLEEMAASTNKNKVIYLQKIEKVWQQEKKARDEKLHEITSEAMQLREQLQELLNPKNYLKAVVENKLRNRQRSQDQEQAVSSTNPVSSLGPSKPKRKLSEVDQDGKTEGEANNKRNSVSAALPTTEQNTKETSTNEIELITLSDSEDSN